MAGHTYFGKRKLCYTEVIDFTDFQGIGRDPLYKRYESVLSVLKRAIAPHFQHFLAAPQYMSDDDQICWHIDEWTEQPRRLTELVGSERTRYEAIRQDTLNHYRQATEQLEGEHLQILGCAIRYVDDERIYCADGKVFLVAWGMTPDTRQHKAIGSILHEYDVQNRHLLTFELGAHGTFANPLDKSLLRPEGSTLNQEDMPHFEVHEGWEFIGWAPSPIGWEVVAPATFTAQYRPAIQAPLPPLPEPEVQYHTCTFDPGEHGVIEGWGTLSKASGSTLEAHELPLINSHKGYAFTGWSPQAEGCIVDSDRHFVAQYEARLPWYKRFWLWLLGLFGGLWGCLSGLLGLLLLLALLAFFLRSCTSCIGDHAINGVVPIGSITMPDGSLIDDNGTVQPITGADGKLPEGDGVVAPVLGEGGAVPPILRRPGVPATLANRLFLFMEEENGDLDALARDFKAAYLDEQYSIIGFDREVKLLVVQVPEDERESISQTINQKIPQHKFLVLDEEVYEQGEQAKQNTQSIAPAASASPAGWHLKAIHLQEGWRITKGSPDVKVAVIDDGIDAEHPMFSGRIVDAYNVFTQNNNLSLGEGHGTHTAGLAVGSDAFLSKGASGVAPMCQLIPVQVFDNKMCPTSALVAGIMYALHHGADVVNISIGPSFQGLNALPVETQDEIARTQFQNMARLWARVCKIAERKRSILVFAAGNDDILSAIPPENRNTSSIVVTAVDHRLYPTSFTNYGTGSDISAPGQGILSAFPHKEFRSLDGTSMSAPIVTGAIALMKSLKRDLTVQQARDVLFSTGADVYGWVPPMVLLDKVLAATRQGNFQRRERQLTPVPEEDALPFRSGRLPEEGAQDGGFMAGDGVTTPENGGAGGSTEVQPGVVVTPLPDQQTGQPTTPGSEGNGHDASRGTRGTTPSPPDHGTHPGNGPAPKPVNDYELIRKKIAEYKRAITELEKQLPKK